MRRVFAAARLRGLEAGQSGLRRRRTEEGFEGVFYPLPVQSQVHDDKGHEDDRQDEVNASPLVAGHSKQGLYIASSVAAGGASAESAGAGRQDVLHNGAGARQRQQHGEAGQVDNEVQRIAFHLARTCVSGRVV